MGAFDDAIHVIIPDPNDVVAAEAFRKKWNWDVYEQVIIKGTYTAAEMEAVSNSSVVSSKKGEIQYQAGTARTKLLECMIIDWTLSRNGRKVPVSPHSIRQLPFNYTSPILEVCDKMASTLTDEDQTDFLDSVNEPFSENLKTEKTFLTLS